jgi:hypothetical protein
MLGRDSDTVDEDAPDARLDRIHPVVGFVGGSALAAGLTRAWYTDGGLLVPALLYAVACALLVVGEVEHYRTRG